MDKDGIIRRIDEILEGKANPDFLALSQNLLKKLAAVEAAARKDISKFSNSDNASRNKSVRKILLFALLVGPIISQYVTNIGILDFVW